MKLISDGEILQIYRRLPNAKTDVEMAILGGNAVAQAQLEADQEVIRGIFERIERLKAKKSAFHTFDNTGVEDCILIKVKDWQELKKEYVK